MYYVVYDYLRLGERKKGGREIQPLSPPQVNGAKQICADVCLLTRMLTRTQLMRCHYQQHFSGGEKVSILNRLVAALGLGILNVRPLGRISKRNGVVKLKMTIFGNICLVSLESTSVFPF